MAWNTDEQLKTRVAAVLKKRVQELPDYWGEILAQANDMAKARIQNALMARGFTIAQTDAWDKGSVWHYTWGIYFAMVLGASLHGFDSQWIDRLDPKETFETVMIDIGGGPQNPAGNAEQSVASGSLNTADDRFTPETKW